MGLAVIPPFVDDLSDLSSPPPAFPFPARNDSPTPSHGAADAQQDFHLAAALPDPVVPQHLPAFMTPPCEPPDPGMNLLVGGALAPMVPSTPSLPFPLRPNPRLQLPSFESLGIAARHPDPVPTNTAAGPDLDRMTESSRLPSMPATFAPTAMIDDVACKDLLHSRVPASYEGGGPPLPRHARSLDTPSLDSEATRHRADSTSSYTAVDKQSASVSTRLGSHDGSATSPCGTVTDPSIIHLPLLNAAAFSGDAHGTFADLRPTAPKSRNPQTGTHAHVMPLTPPMEHNDHNWQSTLPVPNSTASMSGRDATEGLLSAMTIDSSRSDHDGVPQTAESRAVGSSDTPFHINPLPSVTAANNNVDRWAFVDLINSKLNHAVDPPTATNPTNVSCQTLPGPLSNNRHSPLYVRILDDLQDGTPQDNGAAIRVWYLIRKGVSCGDGPVSPPATPRATLAEDYFTPKVYDFLARTPDYQNDQPAIHGTTNNVLPLASINISVLERYIPPASPNECRQLFDTHGLSALVDRLTELSPSHGCLVFVYPTKKGATDFMTQYLDPLLGPILRSAMIINNLPCDLSASIGTMSAISELYDYRRLQEQMFALCAQLSHASMATQRFHGVQAQFDVIYNGEHRVQLSRDCWADWWTKQEKSRVKDVVTRHLQAAAASKRPHNDYGQRLVNATELSQQIMTAVETREYAAGTEPVDGVEVGVFVVQRSA